MAKSTSITATVSSLAKVGKSLDADVVRGAAWELYELHKETTPMAAVAALRLIRGESDGRERPTSAIQINIGRNGNDTAPEVLTIE